MAKWKTAFRKSLDPKYQTEERFEFGPPATDDELATLETAISAKIPNDLKELLREFNGVKQVDGQRRETYYFSSKEMPSAVEYYRENWWPDSKHLLEWSKNILYVCQENGNAEMFGMVVKPFGPFEYGQVVAFDHEKIPFYDKPEGLFAVPYEDLDSLVEAHFKNSE